jgi:hypothetical protein
MSSEEGKINYHKLLPAIIGLVFGVGVLIVAIIIFYGVQTGLIVL